jgi:hypothetical protein
MSDSESEDMPGLIDPDSDDIDYNGYMYWSFMYTGGHHRHQYNIVIIISLSKTFVLFCVFTVMADSPEHIDQLPMITTHALIPEPDLLAHLHTVVLAPDLPLALVYSILVSDLPSAHRAAPGICSSVCMCLCIVVHILIMF